MILKAFLLWRKISLTKKSLNSLPKNTYNTISINKPQKSTAKFSSPKKPLKFVCKTITGLKLWKLPRKITFSMQTTWSTNTLTLWRKRTRFLSSLISIENLRGISSCQKSLTKSHEFWSAKTRTIWLSKSSLCWVPWSPSWQLRTKSTKSWQRSLPMWVSIPDPWTIQSSWWTP